MAEKTHQVATCPYCKVRYVSFTLLGRYVYPQSGTPPYTDWSFIKCGHCFSAAMSVREVPEGPFATPPGPILFPPTPGAPEHLPEKVDKLYSEALDSQPTGAGMLLRKTLEVSLKEVRPNDKGTLAKRIGNAANDGEITEAMAEWAGRIRVIGNAAAHDEDPPDRKEIEELERFVRLLLMYLFTLPTMLENSRQDPE